MSTDLKTVLSDVLQTAIDNDFSSLDVSDLHNTALGKVVKHNVPPSLRKYAGYPHNLLVKYKPDLIRKFITNKVKKYPQGLAMVLRGVVSMYQKDLGSGHQNLISSLKEQLIAERTPLSEYFAWGQPFVWYSRKPFPKHIPRATVSSQVSLAFLDVFDEFQDEEYLDLAYSTCQAFMNEFNYSPDANGNYCLSYTTIDDYHVHNSSMLAASVILRVGSIKQDEQCIEFGTKLADFTYSHQNADGSYYYRAAPDKLNYMIDNYHTGFVLESFKYIIDHCAIDKYKSSYDKGMKFYYDHLFDSEIPRLSTKKKYPIDIQSIAQSIISFGSDAKPEYQAKAQEVAAYAVDKFYNKETARFGYRLYESGYFDDSYYFRWGDAWMIRALAIIA